MNFLKSKKEAVDGSVSDELNEANYTNMELQLKATLQENAKMKAELEKANLNEKILAYGDKLDVADVAKNLVSDGSVESFESALISLVDASVKNKVDLKESFEATASDVVGTSSSKDSEEEYANVNEAINAISKRDGITKTEALEVVKSEHSELFKKLYTK